MIRNGKITYKFYLVLLAVFAVSYLCMCILITRITPIPDILTKMGNGKVILRLLLSVLVAVLFAIAYLLPLKLLPAVAVPNNEIKEANTEKAHGLNAIFVTIIVIESIAYGVIYYKSRLPEDKNTFTASVCMVACFAIIFFTTKKARRILLTYGFLKPFLIFNTIGLIGAIIIVNFAAETLAILIAFIIVFGWLGFDDGKGKKYAMPEEKPIDADAGLYDIIAAASNGKKMTEGAWYTYNKWCEAEDRKNKAKKDAKLRGE